MLRRIASYAFLIVGIVIGLGAFGHGHAVRNVHAAIDGFPIDRDVSTMLYVVWYFVSGCMLTFGAIIVWTWLRLRAGEPAPMFAVYVIGTLYAAIGIGGMIYRDGDPFMGFFVVLGGVLLASSFALKNGAAVGRVERRAA
jgi:hypothetical protein